MTWTDPGPSACVAHSKALNASVPQLAAPRGVEFDSSRGPTTWGHSMVKYHGRSPQNGDLMRFKGFKLLQTWDLCVLTCWNHDHTMTATTVSSSKSTQLYIWEDTSWRQFLMAIWDGFGFILWSLSITNSWSLIFWVHKLGILYTSPWKVESAQGTLFEQAVLCSRWPGDTNSRRSPDWAQILARKVL